MAVIGEAGVGKTTLIRAAAAAAGLEVREGGALETLAWAPLLALRRAVGDGLTGDATAIAIEVERRVGPQLLFVDDLQWADDDTRRALALLGGRVGVVVAIRTTAPAATEARSLAAALGTEVVELGGVDREAAVAIVRRARPAIDLGAADLLVAEGGGNPLLLEELATRGRPTSSLARALTSRLDALSPAGRDAFALLAVAGHAMTAASLGPGVDELLATGVAVRTERDPATGSEVAVRHSLLAEAMLATLTPARLGDCHDRLTSIITEAGERAHHLAAAGRRSEARAAAQDAADHAATPADRMALLELVARTSDGPAAVESRIVAARLLVAAGGSASDRAIELLLPIVDGPAELLIEREGLLGRAYWDTGDLTASRDAYARGHQLDTGRATAAGKSLAVGEAAFVINVDGDVPEAKRILGRATGSGPGHARAIGTLEAINAFTDGSDTYDALEAAYTELIADPGQTGAAFGIARNAGYVALLGRGYATSDAFLIQATRDFEALQLLGRADELRAEDVQVLLFAGRLEDGLTLAETLLERPLGPRPKQWTLSKQAQLLAAMGQTDAATEILDNLSASVTADFAGRGELLEARIEVESWAGRTTAVLEAFEVYRAIPTPSLATHAMPSLGAQWARLEAGIDPGEALRPQPWRLLAGASVESDGIRALFAGQLRRAATAFAEAAGLWARFHVGRELICRWAHGEALRRDGSTEAADALRETLVRAEGLGYGELAARARRSLRQAGVRVAAPPRETEIQRWARMTSREREALQLVGRGLTTTQIARRMGLGRGTIDQILGSATRKLGAASRIQAAALLANGPPGERRRRSLAAVRTEAEAGDVVLAALAGASLTVESGADPALVERIQGDLRRLGRDDAMTLQAPVAAPELSPDGVGLLGRLAEGMSLGEAAVSLHLSRRTADRRLAEARVTLGVATTAEALLAFQEHPRREATSS